MCKLKVILFRLIFRSIDYWPMTRTYTWLLLDLLQLTSMPVATMQIDFIHSASALDRWTVQKVWNRYTLADFLCCCWLWSGQSLLPSSLLELESLLMVQVAWSFNHIRQVAPTAAPERVRWVVWALPRISSLFYISIKHVFNVIILDFISFF